MLRFITRDMKSADGLPRVYFCCHPDDCGECLDRFSKQLLELTDCAVCCKTDPDEVLDEDILQQMQMFFIPVTASFLNTENTARNREFAFAEQKHIPILPVIADENITPELFNRICGDIQYIDPYSASAAGVGYKEKMKAFLNNILVDSGVTEQIRNAFRAYAFLSYRKKDKGYVNDVMKAVHSDSRCDDVAVWYDEYLTPGENFNDNIRINLDKSKAFILLVTPNITESGNFVITNEYPAALEQEKTIIPVEAVNTDRTLLERSFERIPEAVRLGDRIAVSTMITEKLKLSDEELSAEKNYLLGLAYMSMIDVEKDTEKGISLLEKAADKNHMGALEKLVSIYEIGDGTQKDIEKAIQYQGRLIDLKAEAVDDHKSRCEYMDSRFRLGDILYDNNYGSHKELSRFFENLTDTAEMNMSRCGSDEMAVYYLTAAVRLCKVYSARRIYLQILPVVEKILKVCDEYNDSIHTDKLRYCLISAYTACADLLLTFSDDYERKSFTSMDCWYMEQNGHSATAYKGRFQIKKDAFDICMKAQKLAFELFCEDPQDIERRCSLIRMMTGLAGGYERFGEFELAYAIMQTAENIGIFNTSRLLGELENRMGVNQLLQLRFDSCAVHCEKAAGYFYDLEKKRGGDPELLADALTGDYIAAVSDVLSGNIAGAAHICSKALSEAGTDKFRLSGDVRNMLSSLGGLSKLCLTEYSEENMREFYLKLYDLVCDSSEYCLGRAKSGLLFIISDKIVSMYGDEVGDGKLRKGRESSFYELLGRDAVSLVLCNMFFGENETSVLSAFIRQASDDFYKARAVLEKYLECDYEQEYMSVTEKLDRLQREREMNEKSPEELGKIESEIKEISAERKILLFNLRSVANYNVQCSSMLNAIKFALSCNRAILEMNEKIGPLLYGYGDMLEKLSSIVSFDVNGIISPFLFALSDFQLRYKEMLEQISERFERMTKDCSDTVEKYTARVEFASSIT